MYILAVWSGTLRFAHLVSFLRKKVGEEEKGERTIRKCDFQLKEAAFPECLFFSRYAAVPFLEVHLAG
jgi:hypothetical protein